MRSSRPEDEAGLSTRDEQRPQGSWKYREFLSSPHSTHSRVVALVPPGADVLEFGCATGYMSEVLTNQYGCTVTGIEVDPAAAAVAEQHCARVVVGDAEELDFNELFNDDRFDAVLFADVLEHLKDPAAVLRRVRPFVREGGSVIASIPNVAHGSVRLALLAGRFQYQAVGLLDETHLRFFTREGVRDLFEESGYVITHWLRQRVEIDESEVSIPALPPGLSVREFLDSDPETRTYQFIVRAIASDHAADIGALQRELEKSRDDFGRLETMEQEASRELRRRLADADEELQTLRPLAGIVDELATAREQLARTHEELEAVRRAHDERGRRLVAERLEFANELGELQRHLEAMHRSRSFRFTAPFRRLLGPFRRR